MKSSAFAIFYVYISDGLKIALSTHGLGNISLFYDGGPYHIETNPLICSANWFLHDRDLRHKRVNQLHALEQIRSVIRDPLTSIMVLWTKTVSSIN